MTDWVFAGRKYNLEALDAIYDFGQEAGTAWDWLMCLGFGESTLNVDAVGDNGDSVNIFQGNRIHGEVWETWRGVEGLTRLMRFMWANRWASWWHRFGEWGGWLGSLMLPDPATLPPVIYQNRVIPFDSRVPRRGRAAYVYSAWPHYQGSTRPTWERALQVEAEATLLAMAYAEARGKRFAPPDAEVMKLRAALLDTRQGLLDRIREQTIAHELMVQSIDRVL